MLRRSWVASEMEEEITWAGSIVTPKMQRSAPGQMASGKVISTTLHERNRLLVCVCDGEEVVLRECVGSE